MAAGDLVIPPGFGNAVISWDFTGRTNALTVGMGFSPDSVTDPQVMANTMVDVLSAAGAPCHPDEMNDSYTFLGVKVLYNDDGTMLAGESSNEPVPGTVTIANPQIISSTILVRKRTGLVGKHYAGRLYVPYMLGGEGDIDALGNINSGTVGDLQTQWDLVYTGMTAGTTVLFPNLLHHQPVTGSPPVPTPILNFQVMGKTATQRRRLR